MAKTRVYELARDLNLTNQVLLDKLSELDISVKSHMSSLDDEAVAKVKTVFFGKKEEAIEETRVKPTVIRRRKKKVTIEAAPEPATENIETAAEEQPVEEIVEAEEIAVEQETSEVVEEIAAADEKAPEELEIIDEKAAEEPEKVEEPAAEEPQQVEETPAEEPKTRLKGRRTRAPGAGNSHTPEGNKD